MHGGWLMGKGKWAGQGRWFAMRQHRAINMSTFVCAEFSLLLPQMEARELLQFMQFFQYTYTHMCVYVYMCVCIYVPCDWGNIFLNSWPNFCFTLWYVTPPTCLCVRVRVFMRGSACAIQSCRMPIFICICIWRISIFSCSPPHQKKK